MTTPKPSPHIVFHPLALVARRTKRVQSTTFVYDKKKVLWAFFPNGFQVLAPCEELPYVDMRIAIRHGGFDDGIPGAAHALEHLVCKDNLVEGAHPLLQPIVRQYGLAGMHGISNTSAERTEYPVKSMHAVWRKLLDRSLRIVFCSTTIDTARWKKELPAILSEIHGRSEHDRIIDARRAFLHGASLTRHQTPTIGTKESVRRITVENLLQDYGRHYDPENGLLIVQGLGKPEQAVDYLRHWFKKTPLPLRQAEKQLRSKYTEHGHTKDGTVFFEGSKGIEQMTLRSHPFPFDADSYVTLCSLQRIMNRVLREEFRRKHEWIYSGSVSTYLSTSTEAYISVWCKMEQRHMDEASALWPKIWYDTCHALTNVSPEIRTIMQEETGALRLAKAFDGTKGPRDRSDALCDLWLTQRTEELHPRALSYSLSAFRHSLKEAAQFADLEWQTIKVLPKSL